MRRDDDIDVRVLYFRLAHDFGYVLDDVASGIQEVWQYRNPARAVIDAQRNAFTYRWRGQFQKTGMNDLILCVAGIAQLIGQFGDLLIGLLPAAAVRNQ